MNRLIPISILLFGCFLWPSATPVPQEPESPEWGFFAHRRINRLATLTLPPEMMVFFKKHIDWVSDHATDPDMRRYATSWEAPRHYLDIDNLAEPPFDDLPRSFEPALRKFTHVYGLNALGDTLHLIDPKKAWDDLFEDNYSRYFHRQVFPAHRQNEFTLNADSLMAFLKEQGREVDIVSAFYEEHLTEHGILPYNLYDYQNRLTRAFRKKDSKQILRLCADIGHYVGDAHVPLHTTANYNGQLTNQHGIHGFWESRIPELFADDEYDYFVGKPEYIEDKRKYFWDVVFASNALVDSVLTLERNLRQTFPDDRQMCPDMRNGRVVVAPCRDFAAAYQDVMNGMVERRMRAAIHSVASVWYTAWIDAGQPDLSEMDDITKTKEEEEQEKLLKQAFESGKILGRPEEH